MAPENLEFPFASPFAAGSPFTAPQAEPAQDADTSDEVEAIDGDEDVTDGDSGQGAPAGAAFGLVFQAADPMTRVPRRSRRAGCASSGSTCYPSGRRAISSTWTSK